MNKGFGLSLALCAGAVSFASATTYTVDVSESYTFAAPLALGEAMVSVDGADPVAFSTLLDADGKFTGSGTFVKTGPGFLASANAMTNFTGEIDIAEGALIAYATGDLGPDKASVAPDVVVSDGATLVFSTPKKCGFYNKLTFAGEGVTLDGKKMGAMCLNSTYHQQDYFFYNGWEFTGDALFTAKTEYRMDIGDKAVNLNGHVLTFRPYDKTGTTLCMSGTSVTPGAGGKIVVKGTCRIQTQASGTWSGDASNELVFDDQSYIGYYNNGVKAPWTMVWNTTASLSPGGTVETSPGGWAKTNYMYWTGPVRIEKDLLKIAGAASQRTYSFLGPVYGPGGVFSNSSWLHFACPTNAFEGPVTVVGGVNKPAGLCLYNPGALPLNGQTTTITNAPLMMADNGAYALPAIAYHVSSGTNYSVSGGSVGSTALALAKTGAGALAIETPLAVSGTLTLEEGTVTLPPVKGTLYSGVPGLWRGMLRPTCTNSAGEVVELVKNADGALVAPSGCTLVTTDVATYMNQSATVLSNEVVACMDWMRQPTYPPWTQWEAVSWGGCVWNRSATNENWRFAVAVCGFSRFWLDGKKIISTDDNGRVYFVDKVMTPGPHKVLFKVCPRHYDGPGSIANPSMHTVNDVSLIDPKDPRAYTWGPKMGFAINFEGLKSTNVVDFVSPENDAVGFVAGGDGYRFTCDDRPTSAFDADELAAIVRGGISFSNIVAKAGTTLDLGEGTDQPLPLQSFTGVTTVLNGGLNVCGQLKLATSDIENGGCLTVDGKLTFGAGARLVFDDEGGRKLKGRPAPFTVITARDGIENLPEVDYDGNRWRFAVSADGKSLVATYIPPGALIIVK